MGQVLRKITLKDAVAIKPNPAASVVSRGWPRCILLAWSAVASMQAAPAALTPAGVPAAKIDQYVAEQMNEQHIPGVEVGIYRRGVVLFAKGYGLSNIELNVPVRPEMVFQSGSMGKQFTATGWRTASPGSSMRPSSPTLKTNEVFGRGCDRYWQLARPESTQS